MKNTETLVEILATVRRIEKLCASSTPALRTRDVLTVQEFAAEIGRSTKNCDFVYELIQDGIVVPLRGKRPYLIPKSELVRYKTVRRPRF